MKGTHTHTWTHVVAQMGSSRAEKNGTEKLAACYAITDILMSKINKRAIYIKSKASHEMHCVG